MSRRDEATSRYALKQTIEGQALIMGQPYKLPCRLIELSAVGSRVEILPAAHELTEISTLLQIPGTEIISEFKNACLGPWRMNLRVRRVTQIANGFSIWGRHIKTPTVPLHGLMCLLTQT